MEFQLEKTQSWLRRVQRSNEGVKRMWLVVLSGSAMLCIMFFWLVYVSFTMPRLEDSSRGAGVAEQKTEDASFWEVLGRGVSILGNRIWSRVEGAKKEVMEFKNTAEKMIRGN